MSKQQVIKAIRENSSFLITSHINPEGDAIGSELALASLLARLNKKVCIVNEDTNKQLNFLVGKDAIINRARKKLKFDAAIVLDCPVISRVGNVERLVKSSKILINIDHHISNDRFGDINWVDDRVSCAGELIYELFSDFKIKLNDKEALYLYVAILTDTGSFRYSNTNSKTHRIISELLSHKIEPHLIYEKIYENTSISYIKLLCRVLSSLKKKGKIAYISFEGDTSKLDNSVRERFEDFISYPRALKGVEAAMFFRKLSGNRIKVNFRSKGTFDVNRLARKFGGGGHIAASGAVIDGKMDEVKRKVIKEAIKMTNAKIQSTK
jgi:phosphoesterase RecJ-like protein